LLVCVCAVQNMLVNGEVVPGAIFDFALHLFHK
jgi:hypothetical protein